LVGAAARRFGAGRAADQLLDGVARHREIQIAGRLAEEGRDADDLPRGVDDGAAARAALDARR
jgi:hypothetical protein